MFTALVRRGTIFSFYCKEVFLVAIHGTRVDDELERHGQHRGIAQFALHFSFSEIRTRSRSEKGDIRHGRRTDLISEM
jgi:hypothetical protein